MNLASKLDDEDTFARMKRLLLSILFSIGCVSSSLAGEITVFAAASLKTALDNVELGFEAATGHSVAISYAGSSALARQIEQGAPADVFISANLDWMNRLVEAGLADPDTRIQILENDLVLISHDPAEPVTITPDLDLAGLLGDGYLAMALVDAVPAGIYGKAALTSLGLWSGVEGKVAQSDNVRAALALVSTGEAPFGIVYATDARADPSVTVLGTFPADSHPRIVYPAAATSDNPVNKDFLSFLTGPEARALFTAQGFRVVAP